MFRKISKRSLLLLVLDAAAVFTALFSASFVRGGDWNYEFFIWSYQFFESPSTFLAVLVFLVSFYIFDLYDPYRHFKAWSTTADIFSSVVLGGLILAAIAYLDRSFLLPRSYFVLSIGFLAIFVFCIRMLYGVFFNTRILDSRALILGTGPLGREAVSTIHRTPHSGIQVVGFIHHDHISSGTNLDGLPIVGEAASLPTLIHSHNIQLVILSTESNGKLSEPEFVYTLLKQNVQVTSAAHIFERFEGIVPYQAINDQYLLGFLDQVNQRTYLKVKRMIDLVFASLFLVLLSPVFLMTVITLGFQGIKKIFFVQTRVGKGGIPFQLIKFRTMTDSTGEKKVTRFGQWLRKYRIDELPQMLNVLKGDMSLVGPRPEVLFFAEECQRRIPFYNVVSAVRPGLTGWAQVKFGYTTSEKDYERKFCYNLYYLKNMSPVLDLVILLKTIRIILLGRGQ